MMTKITLNIPDNELSFFMKLIEKFNYERRLKGATGYIERLEELSEDSK